MKKALFTILACVMASFTYAGSILIEGFEYANHDETIPVGWTCDDNSWLCGYLEKDHNRIPHSGNWYAFTEGQDSWMYMPLYLLQSMQYRFTCWAISDGSFQLEFWAGAEANPEAMIHPLMSETVDGGMYDKYSAYIETIPSGCTYVGIHAVAGTNATCLTIDDIEIDMVEQYDFIVHEVKNDTVLYPGTQGTFHLWVQNLGYEPLQMYMSASNEFFTNVQYDVNGSHSNNFPIQPDEIVRVTLTATLRPEIEPGTVCWLDVVFSIPCDCSTGLATFWVTPLDITATPENNGVDINVYPNPSTDFVTIEADNLMQVTLFDMTGKALSTIDAKGQSVRLDVSDLKAGVYLISATTRSTSSFVKSILKM